MTQYPSPESYLLKWCGDVLTVTLRVDAHQKGRAVFRTNIGHASIHRREIIAETEQGVLPSGKDWADIPLNEVAPGVYRADISLNEVGVFSGKACFFPEGSSTPIWPEGRNARIKVESEETKSNNSIYCVFPRQFGSFREMVRRLPTIMDKMGFRIIQTLPPFPVPTTYAVMGEYGCPFAATDFMSVDPALAEFDTKATPLDQFRELIGAVHARGGRLFIDLPANHTGWASTLQIHHPDWFKRASDGTFISPGAWGVTWADLVELDYANCDLRAYMADVFLYWCRLGVDGFRCDAGYMISAETWSYFVSRVREEYPDTIFMLEGLGGSLETTDRLLAESNLDWAYSELFQTFDRAAFEWYLPQAFARSEKYGALVHFAETHDNDRLAKNGETYARLRVQLAALLSAQGAWGIANGVEWFCREKIDVHGKNDLNWGSADNMIDLIARLNAILRDHPSFAGTTHLELVTAGEGNTLAVRREGLLILANLDCSKPTNADWKRSNDETGSAIDLLTDLRFNLSRPIGLAPGQVVCLSVPSRVSTHGKTAVQRTGKASQAIFHIVLPRDVHRDVVLPEACVAEVSCDFPFRLRIIDPANGCTLFVARSKDSRVLLSVPSYEGSGEKCRQLTLKASVYRQGHAECLVSKIFIPPPSTKAKILLSLSGTEIRHAPCMRTILSNGAGAASQLRLGWGIIQSQYDAILAANLNENCPSDRINIWTQTRIWLQHEGYVFELDAQCLTRFTADPSGRFATWLFTVPCGMGLETQLKVDLALQPNENSAHLKATRLPSPGAEPQSEVRLVFRPYLEWRSFHSTTKAYLGLEKLFAECCETLPPALQGLSFHPYDKTFTLTVSNGAYHHEYEWRYSIGHGEEAARGQDGSGDLFSPGWISSDLKTGESIELVGSLSAEQKPFDWRVTESRPDNSFSAILKESLRLFIVRRDGLKTVIAGYPWFLDWGRDTFIFMRGMIAAGFIDESLQILKAFAKFELHGTLPNIIYGETAGNRDTTDAPLWFIRCVEEIARFVSVKELLPTCEAIVDGYLKGTENGIHVDDASCLVWSPSHFTWMDTNHPACTPRVGYPVEIEALWISALKFMRRGDLAEKALLSLQRLFKSELGYCDCLSAPNAESADCATPDRAIRPNQLFLITLGVLNDQSILRATEELIVPGGMRSLSATDANYRGVYSGDEDTSRKPAYHNGTVWTWLLPLYAEAMSSLGIASREVALQILTSSVENLNSGTLAHLSEIADGDAPHEQKGCTAQAWGISELLRVWLKLKGC